LRNTTKEEFMLRRKHQALRGVLAHSPAIAISVLALVFAVGSGAGYAASTATSVSTARSGGPTILVWHQLKLGRGWEGDLEYTTGNGIVYLTGIVNVADRKHASVMATLPRSLAPEHVQIIATSFDEAGDGSITIGITGQIRPYTLQPIHINAVSLDGVSFAAGAP
jgi:hypothetical protein